MKGCFHPAFCVRFTFSQCFNRTEIRPESLLRRRRPRVLQLQQRGEVWNARGMRLRGSRGLLVLGRHSLDRGCLPFCREWLAQWALLYPCHSALSCQLPAADDYIALVSISSNMLAVIMLKVMSIRCRNIDLDNIFGGLKSGKSRLFSKVLGHPSLHVSPSDGDGSSKVISSTSWTRATKVGVMKHGKEILLHGWKSNLVKSILFFCSILRFFFPSLIALKKNISKTLFSKRRLSGPSYDMGSIVLKC